MIKVKQVDYHRNGVSGEGFYVVRFEDDEVGAMLAVVFPPYTNTTGEPDWDIYDRAPFHNPRVAVFKEDLLPDITFGVNSWRGDRYPRELYQAIKNWDHGV